MVQLRRHLVQKLEHPRLDTAMLAIAFASALVDTMTVPTMHVFVANSTGNVLLLALGAAGLKPLYPELVWPGRFAACLVASWLAAFVTGHLSRRYGARTRWYLAVTFTFNSLIILICAILLYAKAVEYVEPGNYALIILLAWVFGAQPVLTKGLAIKAIPMPQVVTGTLSEIFADPNLFAWKNDMRNQRVIFVLVFFIGCLIGGVALRFVNPELVLVLCAAAELVAAGLFLVLPASETSPIEVGELKK